MADFSNFTKLRPTDAGKEYTFTDLVMGVKNDGEEICPSLMCRAMADCNPDYLNERVRVAVERAERDRNETAAERKRRVLSSDQIERDREDDRLIISRTCVVGWGVGPIDVEGITPEFSPEECYAFLKAIPNHSLDAFRNWLGNVYNFVDRRALLSDAAKEALGN